MEINTKIAEGWIQNSYKNFGMVFHHEYRGPTVSSNWLIPNKLLVGGYPDRDDDIKALENAGITTFVCLNEEYGNNNLHRPFPAYAENLNTASFIHFPMKDMAPHKNDKELLDFCRKVAALIKSDEMVFLHCSGGHGRTGLVATIVLHLLTGYDADVLFEFIQFSHDQRVCHKFGYKYFNQLLPEEVKKNFVMGQVPSPQIAHQRYQAYRCIISVLRD